MKKPKITTEYKRDVAYTNVKPENRPALDIEDEVTEAYDDMIDALIEAYLLIDDMPIDDRKERHLRIYNKIADALEKAGVEL